jgi:hypothetical protein
MNRRVKGQPLRRLERQGPLAFLLCGLGTISGRRTSDACVNIIGGAFESHSFIKEVPNV